MRNLMKHCLLDWLNWQVAAMAILAVVGIVVCMGLPTLSVLAGATPLLLLAVCLLPCLLPLVVARKRGNSDAALLSQQQK
jgi:hypothetical protein